MFIHSISIRNFRSHVKTTLEGLERFNIFQGPNNTGKTTILDAIYYALTGTCRGLDDGGRGSDGLKTQGVSKGMSSVVLRTNEDEIGRTVGQGPRTAIQSSIEKKLGGSANMMKVLVSPMNFLSLTSKAQKDILMSVIGSQIHTSKITHMLGDLANHVEVSLLTNASGMDACEKQLREKRPIMKAQIREHEYTPREDLPELPEFDGTIVEMMETAQSEMDALRRARDKVIKSSAASKANFENYEERKVQLGQIIETVKGTLDEMGPDRQPYVERLADLRTELEAKEREENERDEAKQAISQRIAKFKGKLEVIRENVRQVAALKSNCPCPLCKQNLAKTAQKTTLEEMKATAAHIEKEMKKQNASLNEINQQSFDRMAAHVRSDVNALEKGLLHYDNEKVRYEQARDELKSLGAPPKVSGPDVKEMDQRIENGEALLEAIREHITDKERAYQSRVRKSQIEAQLDAVEKIIALIGPKGELRLKLLGGGLEEFIKEIRVIADHFGLPGFNIELSPFKIFAKGRPAAMLSKSEQVRLTLALSGVLAKRSKLGILCLDDAESLDGENQGLLPDALDMCGLEQVFISGVKDEPKGSAVEDWAFFGISLDKDGHSIVKDVTPAAV